MCVVFETSVVLVTLFAGFVPHNVCHPNVKSLQACMYNQLCSKLMLLGFCGLLFFLSLFFSAFLFFIFCFGFIYKLPCAESFNKTLTPVAVTVEREIEGPIVGVRGVGGRGDGG